MANEASILVTLRDQYSPNVQRMRDANSGFGRSMEEIRQKAQAYQTRLEGLVKQQAQLQTKLVDAKKALKDAEKAYKETADEANAEALTQAREKYEALNVVLRETSDASRETGRTQLQASWATRASGQKASFRTGQSRPDQYGRRCGQPVGAVRRRLRFWRGRRLCVRRGPERRRQRRGPRLPAGPRGYGGGCRPSAGSSARQEARQRSRRKRTTPLSTITRVIRQYQRDPGRRPQRRPGTPRPSGRSTPSLSTVCWAPA